MQTGPHIHTVQRGETLSGIAAKYGFSDWKKVYQHPANEALRKQRPNPNNIVPGDKVNIPPDSRRLAAELRNRLQRLEKVRFDSIAMFDKLEKELAAEYGKTKTVARNVDTAAFFAGVFVNLASLTKSCHAAMKLEGEALKQLNKQVARDLFVSPTSTYGGVAAFVGSGLDDPADDDGLAVAFGKIVLKSWGDMWSPSYWAGRFVGKHPDQAYHDALKHLRDTRARSCRNVEDRIAKNRALLQQIEVL
jgi:hypothetical protein